MYDYCIIGAGPTGLTLAFLFSKIGKKCIKLLEDKDKSFMEGCLKGGQEIKTFLNTVH